MRFHQNPNPSSTSAGQAASLEQIRQMFDAIKAYEKYKGSSFTKVKKIGNAVDKAMEKINAGVVSLGDLVDAFPDSTAEQQDVLKRLLAIANQSFLHETAQEVMALTQKAASTIENTKILCRNCPSCGEEIYFDITKDELHVHSA